MFLQEYLRETTTSALDTRTKELAAYLCCGGLGQCQKRRFFYKNPQGVITPFQQIKHMNLSVILCGKPGSYKSETIRLIKRVFKAAKLPVYPHDQVSREYLLSTLSRQGTQQGDGKAVSIILIDELVNFLNRVEYVEPLIGTLNSLLDQPDEYGVGTHKRATEILKAPLVSFFGACAPGWFQYLPEALFSGGFAGRCLFYWVNYPEQDALQPRGQISQDGAAERLAGLLVKIPKGDLILTYEAIKFFDHISLEWGKEEAHPLPVVDEWLKRRAIQTVRLAGAVAMSDFRTDVTKKDMETSHLVLDHVTQSVEEVWQHIGGDVVSRFQMLELVLKSKLRWSFPEVVDTAVKYLRNPSEARRSIDWWINHGMLVYDKHGMLSWRKGPTLTFHPEGDGRK